MTEARTFPNEAGSVTEARRYVLHALGNLAPGVGEAVAVMVSELAANAVRHTASDFTVGIERNESEIRIAVSDSGSGSPTVRAPKQTEPSGRGLQLVSALAAEWGVISSPAAAGKTVWFTIGAQPQVDAAPLAHEMARPYEGYASDAGASPSAGGLRETDGDDFGGSASRARARDALFV